MSTRRLPGIYLVDGYRCHIYHGKYEFSKQNYLTAVYDNGRGMKTIPLTDSNSAEFLKENEVLVKSTKADQLIRSGIIKATPLSPTKGVYELLSLGPIIE